MKLAYAIKTGLSRSLKAWKGIIVFWLISIFMVSFLVVPFKAGMKAVLGKSMITEKLTEGLNLDVLGDFGTNFTSMGASLFSGVLVLALAAILVNIFITGGFFNSVKSSDLKGTYQEFFRASAKNFWPFLVISSILYIIALLLIIVIIVVPVSIAGNAESAPEGIIFKTLAISGSVFILAISIVFLVADYARAWQAARAESAGFKALGFGFRQTFRTFFQSLGLMLLIIVLQVLVAWCVMKIIAIYTPSRGAGVFLLFIVSQLLLVVKILIKVLRYASVSSLMEQNLGIIQVPSAANSTSDYEIPHDLSPELKSETDV
ncbi:MAG: hypothetical protein IPJ37_22505 [Bacteroidales bacterium]|nr:hypothetical protein [Bacteroidales bacterium]